MIIVLKVSNVGLQDGKKIMNLLFIRLEKIDTVLVGITKAVE